MTKAKTPTDKQNFEHALGELEHIVSDMESGKLALAESLEAYQRGILLLKNCQLTLTNIEQQVQILSDSHQLNSYHISDD